MVLPGVDVVSGNNVEESTPIKGQARMAAGAAVVDDTVYDVGGHPGLEAVDMVLALRFR